MSEDIQTTAELAESDEGELRIRADISGDVAFTVVIALTTYFSVVIGELVPKQLALRAAIPISLVMARPMAMLARIAAPLGEVTKAIVEGR